VLTRTGGKLERERAYFWGRFADELGDLGVAPETLWDARIGFFSVAVGDVGDMTPAQLLGCVDMFNAIHGSSDG
jgi:hypothetical protein